MSKIKIITEALGYVNEGYEPKQTRTEKILNKTSTDDSLKESDLEKIVKTMISEVKEIKALYSEKQKNLASNDDNRLEEIRFRIEILNKNDEPIALFDEKLLFDKVALHDSLCQLIINFCEVTNHGEEGTRVWSDEETPAGTYAILALIMKDKKWMSNYIDFLRTNDLDHEVEQFWHIEEIIKKYGWCKETVRLAVARMVSCNGQSGLQQFKGFLENGLSAYLTSREKRKAFLQHIIQEFKDWESGSYVQNILDAPKEYYIKQMMYYLEDFNVILNDAEINKLKKEIASRWDVFHQKR